jgi:ElaB/YqjD/DUF883 family membrane-anchored ribosome-binding protein
MAKTIDTDLSSELKSLRDEVLRLSEQVSTYARDEAEYAGVKVKDAVHEMSRKGRDFAETARDKVETVSHDVEDQIARNPWMAVLIASGIGLMLGMMSRSRD